MKLVYLFKKEMIEVFRQKEMVAILFIAPLVQTILLGYVVRTDVRNIPVEIVNLSASPDAYRLINRISHSPLFRVRAVHRRPLDYEEVFKRGKTKAILVFQEENRGRNVPAARTTGRAFSLQVLMDGSDANSAMIAAGYFYGLIKRYLEATLEEEGYQLLLSPRTLIRFNPSLNSIHYMGPAIVALLLMLTTLILTAIALVREKEQQTLDTLLISPLNPVEIFLGKTLPMALIGLMEMTLGVVVVLFLFRIHLRGNLGLLFLAAVFFLFSILSLGFLLSLISQSQQQALFFAWFMMVLFLMLSGLLTPVENIPGAFRWLADINPLRYLVKIIREIFLKGNGLAYFWKDLAIMAVLGLASFFLSLFNFSRSVVR